MINSKSIVLRAMEPEDIDKLYLWENDPEVWIVSNTYIPFSKHFLSQFIINSQNDLFIDKQLRLMIMLKKDETCIGTLDFFEFDPMHKRAGLGILVDKEHRNKGIASEAISLAIQYAFDHLNLHQLFCHITEDNDISAKVFFNAGFEQTGIKKDWILTSTGAKNVLFLQYINNGNK